MIDLKNYVLLSEFCKISGLSLSYVYNSPTLFKKIYFLKLNGTIFYDKRYIDDRFKHYIPKCTDLNKKIPLKYFLTTVGLSGSFLNSYLYGGNSDIDIKLMKINRNMFIELSDDMFRLFKYKTAYKVECIDDEQYADELITIGKTKIGFY